MLDQEMKASECEDKDIQRNWVVELDLVPHPHLSRPELVRMDYGMRDGSIHVRVRADVAGYMLLR